MAGEPGFTGVKEMGWSGSRVPLPSSARNTSPVTFWELEEELPEAV
jgi:hypothetical protein